MDDIYRQEQDDLNKKKDNVARKRESELNDIRKVLSSAYGRRVIWRFLSAAKLFHSTFDGSSKTFYREGWRDFGLFILNDVNEADSEAFYNMFLENGKPLANETGGDR